MLSDAAEMAARHGFDKFGANDPVRFKPRLRSVESLSALSTVARAVEGVFYSMSVKSSNSCRLTERRYDRSVGVGALNVVPHVHRLQSDAGFNLPFTEVVARAVINYGWNVLAARDIVVVRHGKVDRGLKVHYDLVCD
jgi:hypothetical protein